MNQSRDNKKKPTDKRENPKIPKGAEKMQDEKEDDEEKEQTIKEEKST